MDDKRKRRTHLVVLMVLAFVLGLSVIPIIFMGAQVLGIMRSTSIENAFATRRVQLSGKVWLLATNGQDVMLADEDGMGLVYGDVVMAGYMDQDKQALMVAYVPYVRGSDDTLGTMRAAEVDLTTGQVTERSAVSQRELINLHGVFAFMDDQ